MEANRVIFQELAAPWKFILDLAVSGEEAVQMVKEREYQMIILDQMMPGMSGFETADQIQRYSHAPLVLMTADISDEVRKPFHPAWIYRFYAETDPAAADEAGFRNRNSGKIQGTSESGRCVKEGESHRTEERCEYPHAGILLERGGEFTSETSGVCSAGSAYVSDKSSWNQRYQPPDWKRGDCPAGRNYGDGGKDRKSCLYKPESAYFFRAAAGDGERSKTGDKRFTGKRSHTSAGKVSHDGWRAAPAVLEKVKVWI